VKLTTHIHLVPGSKNAWNYTSAPPIRLHGVVLSYKKKHRDNFTFTFAIYPFIKIRILYKDYKVGKVFMLRAFSVIVQDLRILKT